MPVAKKYWQLRLKLEEEYADLLMDLDPKKVQILTEELNFLQNFKKLGPEVKKGDPHEKSMNSDLLLSILTRNNLIVCY